MFKEKIYTEGFLRLYLNHALDIKFHKEDGFSAFNAKEKELIEENHGYLMALTVFVYSSGYINLNNWTFNDYIYVFGQAIVKSLEDKGKTNLKDLYLTESYNFFEYISNYNEEKGFDYILYDYTIRKLISDMGIEDLALKDSTKFDNLCHGIKTYIKTNELLKKEILKKYKVIK